MPRNYAVWQQAKPRSGGLLNIERYIKRADVSVAIITSGNAQQIFARFQQDWDANGNPSLYELLVGLIPKHSLSGLGFPTDQFSIRRERTHLKFQVGLISEFWARTKRNSIGVY